MSTQSVKSGSKKTTQEMSEDMKNKALLKAQRKALFEEQNKDKISKTKNKEMKSKSELKAERRAKQEMQRTAKIGNKEVDNKEIPMNDPKNGQKKTTNEKIIKNIENNEKENQISNDFMESKTDIKSEDKNQRQPKNINEDMNEMKPELKKSVQNMTTTPALVKRGQIFAHIPKRIKDLNELSDGLNTKNSIIPPIVIQIGFQFNANLIRGSNSRCVAMLLAFKKVIEDYITPPSKELTRDLESMIDTYVKFLAKCRPLSISMTNAVKFLKQTFSRIPAQTNDSTAKKDLCKSIDNFISDEIIWAQRGIAELAITKVHDSDVILTFGCSLIVKNVIYRAAKRGKKFRVVVVDSRPRFDGKEMIKFLVKHKIPANYVFINAISYVMKEVTKVLLGAHSLLANGYVMSHIGSSQIALVAQANNVPVLVCCETYKFSERVHTDSFVHNEIGDSTDLLNSLSTSSKSKINVNNKDLYFLDLLYDVTPHEFVSVVITEKGILPCTSAPAVLRVRETK